MDNLCYSRSNALLRSWQSLCYGRGNRYATVVAYALLQLWHMLLAWRENNEHDGMWITNDKVLSSPMTQSYHRV
ncbi:MAG: hypothetical protein J6B92_04795 [Paraprevotella sp.]|nr:hypothetical protein [Paraprevotella sp.]